MRKAEIRKTVLSYHRNSIAYDGKKGMFYTRHPADYRKRLYAKTEDALYERLFRLYEEEPALRGCPFQIGTLFDNALDWIANTQNKSPKTLQLHRNDWNRLFAKSRLAQKDIRDVQPNDYYQAFVDVTKDGKMTRKRFRDVLTCFTYIYDYVNVVCNLHLTIPMFAPMLYNLKFNVEAGRQDEI